VKVISSKIPQIKEIISLIFIIILWIIFAYNTENILDFINSKFNWILIFISILCLIHFFDLILKKDFKKLRSFLLTLLIIFLFVYFVPILSCQKKELSNGTLMSRNRFNGQISIKLPNDEFTHFQKDNPFYKEMLIFFRNH